MKYKFNRINSFIAAVCVAIFFSSCANIIPPTGGPRDSLPPLLTTAFPKDSTINFNSKKITLTFNEFVEATEIQQNLVMNPQPKNQPTVDYKLQNVVVTLKDSLEPNTTYTINFGNAIKDVNEGNIAKNKTYTFSTGNYIDSNTISGNVVLAQDGKIDSTLIAVLYSNLADSAVMKLKPKYLAKLNGKGFFKFTNLPNTTFNLFVLPNDYSKKYDDSTKLFGFLNQPIDLSKESKPITLYAYKQTEPEDKKTTPKQDDNAKQNGLKYNISLVNNRFDILDTAIVFSFNKKIKLNNNSIQLTDTNYVAIKDYQVNVDTDNKDIIIKSKLDLGNKYCIIIPKDAVMDTLNNTLSKSDTIRFSAFDEKDYGSVKIRFNQKYDSSVLQILSNGKLFMSIPINSKEIYRKLFKPGEYELRILFDENNNGIWDAGNYKLKRQPEKVITLTTKLLVKNNWENEIELSW